VNHAKSLKGVFWHTKIIIVEIGKNLMIDKDTYQTYKIGDELWGKILPLLPPEPPRMDDRKVMEAIFYILRNGCKWSKLPRNLGVASVVYSHFLQWRESGLFQRMWNAGILEYEELRSLIRSGRKRHQKIRDANC